MNARSASAGTLLAGLLLVPVLTFANNMAPASPVNDVRREDRIRVQFAARNQTTLSSELSAKIARLTLREGDTFKSGQTLITFDCSLFHSQLAKHEAMAEAARQTLSVNRRLAELNSIGTLEVEQAAARVKETQAEVAAMRTTVSKCALAAPFSGRVAKVHAEPHEFVAPGKPLIEILDTRRLELQMIVPSRWLAWLKPGQRFTVRVEELDREYTARVVRTGARIDPVSQTISLAGEVEGERPELLPGMSGWAQFKRDN